MSVLVDTSVWVAHFRQPSHILVALLARDLVLVHPLVIGELACGTPPARAQTLRDIARLQTAQQAGQREVLDFIEREALFGLGCGFVDMTLLTSTLLTPGARLWTLDKRLAALAGRFDVAHPPH
ncbi:type II toxin-antitoxin system VapC family toxin [Pseudorhodoferax sp. Leaf267]|uniref:type II toxin-antitoxin system VapC family toxin n=1 Tax=Pseudorhodoferax sp. Leaf267 TaxID=1736316 RepID=UPI0006FF4D87|nr:type II toxin-antitoxin system VapC family toxin [Pseudorhodoferax sp. Leaf267]KQP19795.1 twitching motility protein PilT [Pseudorhodoferax sp. Leaf267]